MVKSTYEIDGERFRSLDGFYDEVERNLLRDAKWGRNLDAFNDILRGGFGMPDHGFVFRWVNSSVSRECLGHEEMIRFLETKLRTCHPSNTELVSLELSNAKVGEGPTLFDVLVKIIEAHCPGGDEEEDGIRLVLA